VTDGIRIGVLGAGRGATVGAHGQVLPERFGWELDWWIGADDRWHVAADEVAVRQTRLDAMPVVQTSMRVPGGDAVHRAYGAPAPGAAAVAVVDVADESPAPFVVALVVNGASAVDLDGATVWIDGRAALRTTRPPSRWAMAADGRVRDLVTSGGATDAPFAARRDRGAGLVAAFLFPVAHRTALRAAVALGADGLGSVDVTKLPTAPAVARGWLAQLDRGMQVELPDPSQQLAVDTARAALLLDGQAWRADPGVVAALEDWGFDSEAAEAWSRLTGRERRKLATRPSSRGSWEAVRALTERSVTEGAGVELLAALRRVLVREHDGGVVLLEDWPPEWRGLAIDVRDAPTRRGPVSFSVRWHGERAALLWDAPAGLELTVPGLDPMWSTTTAKGEVLLGSGGGDAQGGDLARP
jgi:hypothetical protein